MSDGKFVFLILKFKKIIIYKDFLCFATHTPPAKHLSPLSSWNRLEEEEEKQNKIEVL